MEELSDAKKRLSMNERYDFLTRNYLESEMNDFVVVDHFSQTGVPAREQEKWSRKDVYSFFVNVDDLDEGILDFSNVHDQNCRQYLSRTEDTFPFVGWVMEGGQEEKEDYYQKIKYHTFPAQQIYPLTYHRKFNTNTFDIRGKYNMIEICEDFRHFHGLYPKDEVNNTEKYFKEVELNTEELIAVVKDDDDYCEVKIRKQDLCRYLHYTKRALIIQFSFDEETKYSLAELDEIEEIKLEDNFPLKGNDFCKIQGAIKYSNDHHLDRSYSWSLLKGLVILLPPPMGNSYGEQEAIRFCVGLDNRGNREYLDLDGNWSRLPLKKKTKSVYFDSSVLDYFYENNGSEYIVYDQFDDECPPLYRDILICSPDGYQFCIPLSFHNDDVICCNIEELGMPKKVLLHFQRYNVAPPSIHDMNTPFRDSEISLKKAYYQLSDWRPYMIKLSEGEDESLFFKKIRIPRKVNQECFDQLVHHITKLLIEGIQTVNFRNIVSKNGKSGKPHKWEKMGKIDALAVLLKELKLIEPEGKEHIDFLKSLQKYRSTSVAHAKPEDWRKSLEELGVTTNDLKGGITTIFGKSKSFLHFLIM